ncbi:MAG TPA: hypothetical protein VFV27_06790 [Nevskiaceae bacterium]|nr:hypothetical protein [Nevskiaceae bacterium]
MSLSPHLYSLLATGLALASGPLLHRLAQPHPLARRWLDRAMVAAIVALLTLDAIPHSVRLGGWTSLAFVALGAFGPSLLERGLRQLRRTTHLATLAIAVIGLLLHSLADGAALAPTPGNDPLGLPLAVVLHSVPVSLTVWLLLLPLIGALASATVLLSMGLATLAGFLAGAPLAEWLGGTAWAWVLALVSGSLLHVVFGRPHLHHDETDPAEPHHH